MISTLIDYMKEFIPVEIWEFYIASGLAAACIIGWSLAGDYKRQMTKGPHDLPSS